MPGLRCLPAPLTLQVGRAWLCGGAAHAARAEAFLARARQQLSEADTLMRTRMAGGEERSVADVARQEHGSQHAPSGHVALHARVLLDSLALALRMGQKVRPAARRAARRGAALSARQQKSAPCTWQHHRQTWTW